MFENLGLLYKSYGGIASLLKSRYFQVALGLSIFSAVVLGSNSWASVSISALPSLTGFSVASFALVFSVLDRKQILSLVKPDKDGNAPLLSFTAAIAHAVVVQVSAILFAVLEIFSRSTSDIQGFCVISGSPHDCAQFIEIMSSTFDFLGRFLLIYAIILILAAVLSFFRMVSAISKSL